VLILVVVAGLAWLLWRVPPSAPSEQAARLPAIADLQITQLTTNGTADRPTISSDGRYVVFVSHDADGDGLWLRQTSTTSNVQIVAPQPGVALFGATFTPDATSIDFVRQAAGGPWEVWRVPFWAARRSRQRVHSHLVVT
jgi:hypothetical protein